jgi:hypothetical protein
LDAGNRKVPASVADRDSFRRGRSGRSNHVDPNNVRVDCGVQFPYQPEAPERWPSGRRRSPAKGVGSKRASWVRIPSSPPFFPVSRQFASLAAPMERPVRPAGSRPQTWTGSGPGGMGLQMTDRRVVPPEGRKPCEPCRRTVAPRRGQRNGLSNRSAAGRPVHPRHDLQGFLGVRSANARGISKPIAYIPAKENPTRHGCLSTQNRTQRDRNRRRTRPVQMLV